MKPALPTRTSALPPALTWAAPTLAPVRSGPMAGAHAVLQRSYAPQQLTLPLRPRD